MKDIDIALDAHFQGHHGVIGRVDVLRRGGSDGLIRARVHRGAWIRRYKNAEEAPGTYRRLSTQAARSTRAQR